MGKSVFIVPMLGIAFSLLSSKFWWWTIVLLVEKMGSHLFKRGILKKYVTTIFNFLALVWRGKKANT